MRAPLLRAMREMRVTRPAAILRFRICKSFSDPLRGCRPDLDANRVADTAEEFNMRRLRLPRPVPIQRKMR